MEEIYPDKCSRCGAPLSWKGNEEAITCGFCSKRNFVKNYPLKQNKSLNFNYKLKNIFSPLKVIFQNKVASFLIISITISLCTFAVNRILNNPVRAYKKEIQKVCREISRTETSDFNAKATNSDCNKYLGNMIISLEKIYLNGQFPFSDDYKKSIKALKDQNIYENLYKQALRIFKSSKPIIAIIQGAAIGGGLGLALSADFRITCKEARFSANFGKLGFHQGFGTSVTLPRIIGNQQAKLLLLTSRRINGEEAYKIGLADIMTDKNLLMKKAEELANEINTSGPLGIISIRKTLNKDLVKEIEKIVIREASEQNKLRKTSDFKEGINASINRRLPIFKGK